MKDTHMALTNNSAIFPGFRPGKSPAVKAVLFDLDDTLWPIVPVIARAEQLLFDWLRQNAPATRCSSSTCGGCAMRR
jgi:putative hydrolase of the HAD superfamily